MIGPLRYESETVNGLPVSFIDYYRRSSRLSHSHDGFTNAVLKFKRFYSTTGLPNQNDRAVSSLCIDLAEIAETEFAGNIDIVIAVLSASALGHDSRSAIAVLARAIAKAIGAQPDLSIVAQSETRVSLSSGTWSRSERQSIVSSTLQVKRCTGRVLLIDDVLTTGATFGSYANKLKAAGASVVGGVCLARTNDVAPTLNPGRYDHLTRYFEKDH